MIMETRIRKFSLEVLEMVLETSYKHATTVTMHNIR